MSIVQIKDEKYSVLMSVYNKEEPSYFKESIDSMISQTLPSEQVIIDKDGPLTEELEEIIEQYAPLRAELFTIVPIEENIGLGKALDVGLKHCRNELVARMDTDDISLPNRCEKQVQAF